MCVCECVCVVDVCVCCNKGNGDQHLKLVAREYVIGFILLVTSIVLVRLGEVMLNKAEIQHLQAGVTLNASKGDRNSENIGALKVQQGILDTKIVAVYDQQDRIIQTLDNVDKKITKLMED